MGITRKPTSVKWTYLIECEKIYYRNKSDTKCEIRSTFYTVEKKEEEEEIHRSSMELLTERSYDLDDKKKQKHV